MKRNNLDIYSDILRVSRSGAKKTHLVYKANLNFKIVKKYLQGCIKNGFLEQSGERFYTTEKGSRFLEQYEELIAPFSMEI